MRNPLHEFRHLLSYPRNMRVLLATNFVYAFASPIIGTFVSAYLMRKTGNDVKAPMTYQLMQYVGIPITFWTNGWLLQRVPVTWLYSAGMLISGVSIGWMMSLSELSVIGIATAGLLMGMSSGLYWSNRDFLTVSSTDDSNRNYYYGVEAFLGTFIGIALPGAIGLFIGWYNAKFGSTVGAYYALAMTVFVVSAVASGIINRGQFKNPPSTPYVYFRFHPIWTKLQMLAAIKGVAGGYTVMAPAMLIMVFMKRQESSLGLISSAGAAFTAVLLYILGRTLKPRHRVAMYTLGACLYALATIPNALFYNQAAVFWFVGVLLVAQPLQDMADSTVQMLTIDTVSAIEGRSMYAYILNRELAYFVGRAGGLFMFLMLAYGISNTFALRYALLIVGLIQLLTTGLVRALVKACAEYSTRTDLPAEEVELAQAVASGL